MKCLDQLLNSINKKKFIHSLELLPVIGFVCTRVSRKAAMAIVVIDALAILFGIALYIWQLKAQTESTMKSLKEEKSRLLSAILLNILIFSFYLIFAVHYPNTF